MSCCTYDYYKEKGGYNFGEVPHCGILKLPFIAKSTGVYSFEFLHGATRHKIEIKSIEGESLELDLSRLNESKEVCFRIKNPEGLTVCAELLPESVETCESIVNEEEPECYCVFYLTTRICLISNQQTITECDNFA